MGWAELLFKLGIPYNSDQAVDLARKIMEYITYHSKLASIELAKERGVYQAFRGSIYNGKNARLPFEADDEVKHYTLDWSSVRKKIGMYGIRNATTTTIAPTGTISIIAGASSGIEPLFALSFIRNVMGKTRLFEVDDVFEEKARELGIYSEELVRKIAQVGTLRDAPEVPKELRRIFVTALEIAPEWHTKMQAAFQEFTDNATSKTVNLSYNATPEDVKKIYLLAYNLKCKGITIYRNESKGEQVLYIGNSAKIQSRKKEKVEEGVIELDSETTDGCQRESCKL
jgi:ribonucleoside-diphosphate reductase alpha chain